MAQDRGWESGRDHGEEEECKDRDALEQASAFLRRVL
jgi:hypothetical protein